MDTASQCELLVFDDSPDDVVGRFVESWQHPGVKLRYQRNMPSLGAAGNWNALLRAAEGEYCLLMHHDEFPLGSLFVQRAIEELRGNPDIDVIVMDCVLVSGDGKLVRRHVPHLIRSWVIHHVPAYLFKRNVIGPTSALIVRRSLYPKFDDKLRWLIDVDAYFRLRQTTARWRICKSLQIGSLLERGDSITANMGTGISEIQRQEEAYLAREYPRASMWLRVEANRWLHTSEMALWVLMRGLSRFCGRILGIFGVLPAKRMDIRKALSR